MDKGDNKSQKSATLSFAEKFEAAKKKRSEQGLDQQTITIINVAGKKVKKKSNSSSTSDSLFDSSEPSSSAITSKKSIGQKEVRHKSGNSERVFYVDMEKEGSNANMVETSGADAQAATLTNSN